MQTVKKTFKKVTLRPQKSNLFKAFLMTSLFLAILTTDSINAQGVEQDRLSDHLTSSEKMSKLEEQFDYKNAYIFEGLKLAPNQVNPAKNEKVNLKRNLIEFSALQNKYPDNLILNIPMSSSKSVELLLVKSDIIADDFTFGKEYDKFLPMLENCLFYQGKIKGLPNSTVAVSIFENKIDAMILSSKGNYAIKDASNGQAILSRISGQRQKKSEINGHFCQLENGQDTPETQIELPIRKDNEVHNMKSADCPPLKIKYVVDQTLSDHFNDNWYTTSHYVFARFNETNAIYNSNYWTYGYYALPLQCVSISSHDYYLTNSEITNIMNSSGNFESLIVSAYGDKTFAEHSNGSPYYRPVHVVFFNDDMSNSFGLGTSNPGGQVPICNPGPYANKGVGPFASVGLAETGTAAADYYATTIFAHELGHNYGMGHNNSSDLMGSGGHYLDLYITLYPMYLNYYNCPCNANKTDGQESDENVLELAELTILPNPTENALNLHLDANFAQNAQNVSFEIFNVEGKLVLTAEKLRNKVINIDISQLQSNQTYIISIKSDNGNTISKRFMKK